MRLPLGAVVLSIVLAAAAAVTPSAQVAPLKLVSTAWPPFTNPAGQPRYALDLVEAGLSRSGVTAVTTIVDAARFTPALLSNEFDGSAAAWKDAEREQALIFSRAYLENRLVLVARRGDDVSASSLATLRGKRLAIVEGYSYGEAIDTAAVNFVRSKSEEDSISLLLGSKVDYALMDDLVIQQIVASYPTEARAKLNFGTTPILTRPLYLALRRSRPDAQSIVDRFNAQLRGMVADRTYHRLLHVPWIRADIDGDGLLEFIPETDAAGGTEPTRAYSISTADAVKARLAEPQTGARFYVGGNIYEQWAAVPNRYKVDDPQAPDSRRNTASIFHINW